MKRAGLDYLQCDRFQPALVCIRRAVKSNPDDIALRCCLAQSLIALYRFKDADREYRAAIARSPCDSGLRLAHGRLLEDLQYFDEAAVEYEVASKLNPSSVEGLMALALLEAGRNDANMAEVHILAALERDRCDPNVWAALNEIRLGMLFEAQAGINRSLELLARGYYGSQEDSRIQSAMESTKRSRLKVVDAVQLYQNCMTKQLLEQQSYRDMELELLVTSRCRHGNPSARGDDAWIDQIYAWCCAQGAR